MDNGYAEGFVQKFMLSRLTVAKKTVHKPSDWEDSEDKLLPMLLQHDLVIRSTS